VGVSVGVGESVGSGVGVGVGAGTGHVCVATFEEPIHESFSTGATSPADVAGGRATKIVAISVKARTIEAANGSAGPRAGRRGDRGREVEGCGVWCIESSETARRPGGLSGRPRCDGVPANAADATVPLSILN
jgi:hypothetical protein